MEDELYDYFDTFEMVRAPAGTVVPRGELIRRFAHYLQVPQAFGVRLLKAYEDVLFDALRHGEGFRIPGAGSICIMRFPRDTVMGFGKVIPRKVLYKFKWTTAKTATTFLNELSDLERAGKLDDNFARVRENVNGKNTVAID